MKRFLWPIYIALLIVLLPHTAWAFRKFEPSTPLGNLTAWAAAIAFEFAIAALTDRMTKQIEKTPNYTTGRVWLRKAWFRYGNTYFAGLLVSLAVSSLANFAHAVEFAQSLTISSAHSVHPLLYSAAFGGILPVVSLLFAGVLSKQSSKPTVGLDVQAAKAAAQEAKRNLKKVQTQLDQANTRLVTANTLFGNLTSDEKRVRIQFAHTRWPALPARSIAILADASPSYVSEILATEYK